MSELWRQLALNEAFAAFPLVKYVTDGEEGSFSAALCAAVERAEEEGDLLPAGRELLTAFALDCGRLDRARQEEQLLYYSDRVAALEMGLREEAAVKCRLYPLLGLSAGAALCLLLWS